MAEGSGLPMERVGLEAGGLTPWLCHELLAADWPAICIETRHAKAAMQAQQVKTTATMPAASRTSCAPAGSGKSTSKAMRARSCGFCSRNRRCLLDKRLDMDSQIRGTLKVFGLKTGKVTRGKVRASHPRAGPGRCRTTGIHLPDAGGAASSDPAVQRLEKMILDCVERDQICRLFMTIPGVGPLTALAFKTFVDRPERFRHSQAVGAAVGLTPRKYASGEVDYDGHITKCGDAFLRSHLFEAAKVCLSRGASQIRSRRGGCGSPSGVRRRTLAWRSHAGWRSSCTRCGVTAR